MLLPDSWLIEPSKSDYQVVVVTATVFFFKLRDSEFRSGRHWASDERLDSTATMSSTEKGLGTVQISKHYV